LASGVSQEKSTSKPKGFEVLFMIEQVRNFSPFIGAFCMAAASRTRRCAAPAGANTRAFLRAAIAHRTADALCAALLGFDDIAQRRTDHHGENENNNKICHRINTLS